jgi:hypothetical protein
MGHLPAVVTEALDSMDDDALNRTYRAVVEHCAKERSRA